MSDKNIDIVDFMDDDEMTVVEYITNQPFHKKRQAASFADEPDEHDRKIIDSLPKRELLFLVAIIITVHAFEVYQLYTNWALWWTVFLVEDFIFLKIVTGYPRYDGIDALIMLPVWIPFHLIYIGLAWAMFASFTYLQVSILFGFIGVVASSFGFLLLHIPMFWLQVMSWRVYP